MSRQKDKREKKPMRIQVNRVATCTHIVTDLSGDRIIESSSKDEPFVFLVGDNTDPAFSEFCMGLAAGDSKQGIVRYQEPDEDAIWTEDVSIFANTEKPIAGDSMIIEDIDEVPIVVHCLYIDDFECRLSCNNPLAGQTVRIELNVLSVRAATRREISRQIADQD